MKANPNANEQEAIDHAIERFQKTTKQTQQSNDIQDRDLFQDNPNLRFLQLFKTSQKQYIRKEFSAIRQIVRKLQGVPSKGSLRNNLENFFMYHTVLPVFFQYITLGLPGILTKWDDDDKETLLLAGLIGNINSLFIMGDVIQMTTDFIQEKPWAADADSVPFLEAVGRIVKNGQNWRRSKKPETQEKWRDKTLIEAVSLTGIPVQNVKRVYDNVDDLINKDLPIEAKILKALMFSDYVSEPKEKKKTKTSSSKKRSRSFKRK